MTKLYFATRDSEHCFPASKLTADGITEAFPAVPEKFEGLRYCRHFEMPYNTNDNPCGHDCSGYSPCNGKSGKCRHSSSIFYDPGENNVKLK